MSNLRDPVKGMFPEDFDKRTPEYQRAWLQRKIPQLEQEITEIETELARADEIHRLARQNAKRKKKSGLFGVFKNLFTDPLGLEEGLGVMTKGLSTIVTAQALDIKREQLIEMQARLVSLSAPSPPVPSELTPEQKRAQDKKNCEARIAELKAQKQQALKIDEEDERLRRVNAIDNAIEREYERWSKLL
jgi:hypothetical protein